MKKVAIFSIIACSIAVLVLAGVLFIGLRGDGFDFFSRTDYSDRSMEKNKYEYEWTADELAALNIDWVSGRVDIVISEDSKKIMITESSSKPIDEDKRLKLDETGDMLSISWRDELVTLGWFSTLHKNLKVEVPKELAENLAQFDCSTASGDINVSGIIAQNTKLETASGAVKASRMMGELLEVDTVSGDMKLSELQFGEMKLNAVSGDMEVRGAEAAIAGFSTTSGKIDCEGKVTEALRASSVSGKIEVQSAVCPAESNMSSTSGELVLVIPDNKGFDVEHASISGDFNSDFALSNNARYKSGGAKLHFSTTSGDMELLSKAALSKGADNVS